MDTAGTPKKTISELYRATSLTEVLAAAQDLCKPGRGWCLTRPRIAEDQMLITTRGSEPVDLLIAHQVEKVPIQYFDAGGGGCSRIVSCLAGQFHWIVDTIESHAVYLGTLPIGIAGFTGTSPIEGFSREIARAIEHMVRLEVAHQEADLYRQLLGSCDEACLAITELGRIVAGTEPGRRLLRVALYGSPLSPYTSLEDALPAHILSPLLVGDTTSSNQVTLSAAPFRGTVNSGLVQPLFLVSLRSTEPTGSAISPDRLAKLTPTQKEVYRCLIAGDRNKQIGTRLGMSAYTARNHVSVILAALGCSDRLELIARYRRFNPPSDENNKKHVVPPMVDAPVMEDLPLPASAKLV